MLIGFNWVNTHLTQLIFGWVWSHLSGWVWVGKWVWVDFATPTKTPEMTKIPSKLKND